jgi:hypothetical protein
MPLHVLETRAVRMWAKRLGPDETRSFVGAMMRLPKDDQLRGGATTKKE